MNSVSPDSESAAPPGAGRSPSRLRKELLIFSIFVAIGLVVLPFAIFKTGEILLGDYSSEGLGIGHLYGDILRGLGAGDWTAWLLVLGPWLGIMMIRVLWWPLARSRRRNESAN